MFSSALRDVSRRLRVTAGVCAAVSLFAVPALRGQQPDTTTAATPPVAPGTPAVGFFVPRATLWLGRSMVLPFRLAQASAGSQTLAASVGDASMVEVLRPPAVLAGETTGFLRVRGLRAGKTRLTIHGDAALDLEIKADPAAAVFASIDAESGRPRIVSPVPDAAVWGQFAVGVEVFDANFHASIAPEPPVRATASPNNAAATSPSASATPVPAATPAPTVAANIVALGGVKVQLRLPGGRLLDPAAATGPEVGPQRHFLFNVRAEDFPAGPLAMVAVATPEGGSFVDRQTGRMGGAQESAPLSVRVLRPQMGAFWTGECENPAIMGESKELLAPARPAAVHFSQHVPDVGADPNASGGKTVLCRGGNDAWCLPFNVQSAGDYQLFIQARGDFACGAFPSAALYRDTSEQPVGAVRLAGAKYHRLPVGGPVHLDAGPQVLSVVYRNDFQQGKEDRNLYLDRYEIARVGDTAAPPPTPGKGPPPAGQAHQPPPQPPATSILNSPAPAQMETASAAVDAPVRLSILYPAEGASVFGADAVVARVADAAGAPRPAWVDLVVDGQPQGIRLLGPAAATDTVEFPLLARQLAPGTHRIAVRALDAAGRATDSPARSVRVLDHPPFLPGPYERAVFLLDRLAFGPEPRELAAVLTLGERGWLNNRLASTYDTPVEQAVLRGACQKFPRIDDEHQASTRAIAQWIGSDNPVRSRFTAWTENHFSTWVSKTKAAPKWHEHLDFCWMGVAPFADLLSVSAHSPAMLAYLDQEKSYASKLNENYAREIMELHTLGVHGGYKQADVTALAGVLNGWTTTTEAILPQVDEPLGLVYNAGNESGVWRDFRFDPYLNDGKEREVFGMEFAASKDPAVRYDNIRLAMEMLAAHPSTADHVCRKLAEHYVGVPASDALVRALAQTYLENGGDLRAVMRAMVGHKDFWSAPMKMATPFDFGMRVARTCRAATVQLGADPNQAPNADQIEGFFKKSGMGLFDRVTPDGYPENNGNYADSNALLQRWRFMQTLGEHLNRLVPNNWRTPPAVVVTPVVNEMGGDRPAGPPVVVDPLQRFIDLAAVRLTGHLLDNGSNQAALEVLGQGGTDQMRETLLFIALLPETSLR